MPDYELSADDFAAEQAEVVEAEPETQAIEKVQTGPPKATAEGLGKAIEKVKDAAASQQLAALDRDSLAAKNLSEVPPLALFRGASELAVTPEQNKLLDELADPDDDDIDIRPDGLIYVSHAFHRRVLTKVFGRGNWAEIPMSPIEKIATGKRMMLYQRMALVVNGAFIRDSVGAAEYFPDNPRVNLGEIIESARSDALVRNAAKGSLGIGVDAWVKRRGQAWKKDHAIKVKAKAWRDGGWKELTLWRRKDADPLEHELGLVEEKAAAINEAKPKEKPPTAPAPKPEPKPAPKPEPAREPEPVTVAEAPKPAPSPQVVTKDNLAGAIQETQIRMFFGLCRRATCNLIQGENASDAMVWLCKFMELEPEKVLAMGKGKTAIEVCRILLKKLSAADFKAKLLPALRRDFPKIGI